MNYVLGEDFLRAVAPKFSGENAKAQTKIIAAIAPVFAIVLARYSITSKQRIAHFMAQVSHECAGFRTTQEFASGDAYEGRKDLGNTQKGDGRRYKGRGLIQLTGRANYRSVGAKLSVDLEGKPELAADPVTSLNIACEYWASRNINAAADADDLVRATRLVNGGQNGLADRRKYLAKAKAALAAQDAARIPAGVLPVLRRGSRGDYVEELQHSLKAAGFPVLVDADFGPATELAVTLFQKRAGLTADGIVGARTWAALTN